MTRPSVPRTLPPLEGLLVLDKPEGLSSARATSRVRACLGARKAGHSGTLDPSARGVLVCCLGRATRLASVLLRQPKTYEAVLTLGVETDTQDASGRPVAERPVPELNPRVVEEVFRRFTGEILQEPPAYSALKHEGLPLYAHARRGRIIRKPPRPVTVYALRLRALEPPRVHFEVRCSAGTYIRTLAADIGAALGCGGHLSALARIECAGFRLEEACGLADLEERARRGEDLRRLIVPMARALRGVPAVTVEDDLARRIGRGGAIRREDLPHGAAPEAGWLQVFDRHGELIALLEAAAASARLAYRAVFVDAEARGC
ncbi:MAG: tRNA pseudouridine(55) synthase TruB [Desulfobacterales bacterium]